MSSRVDVPELHEGVFAEHREYGTVTFIGFLESYSGTLCVVKDSKDLLHLVFECDLSDYWYWGD